MVRGILLAVLVTIAKQDAKRLSQRVIAGMRRAAAKGTRSCKPIGRPRVDTETERAIQRLLRDGTGINKAAATLGVGTATFSEAGLQWALSKFDRGLTRRRKKLVQ